MYHHDMYLPVSVESVEKLSTFSVDNFSKRVGHGIIT